MKIKRYIAPTAREVLAIVRRELGPDAVMLSNNSVDGGVEIVVAIDYDADLIRKQAVIQETTVVAEPVKPEKPVLDLAREPMFVDMRQQLNSMRELLEQQLTTSAWAEAERRNPMSARLVQDLFGLGISKRIGGEIAAAVDCESDYARMWRKALAVLSHRIHVTDGDDILNNGGVVALVGSTGVGKTTSLAKLAARFVLRHGAHEIALLSIDRERIGAQEQLRTYGRILGIPVHIAVDTADFNAKLTALRSKRLVLVDTAGVGHQSPQLSDQLTLLSQNAVTIRSYLVLPATMHFASLDKIVSAFGKIKLHGCILTKFDEAESLCDLLGILTEYAMPAAYISNGPRIPEDLKPARAHQLIVDGVAMMQRAKDNRAANRDRERKALHARF
jgi:flagellar biosynthesis protein FlhF